MPVYATVCRGVMAYAEIGVAARNENLSLSLSREKHRRGHSHHRHIDDDGNERWKEKEREREREREREKERIRKTTGPLRKVRHYRGREKERIGMMRGRARFPFGATARICRYRAATATLDIRRHRAARHSASHRLCPHKNQVLFFNGGTFLQRRWSE